MFGFRGRIGLIYPSTGLIDFEFSLFIPKGVSVHIARFINNEEEFQRVIDGNWGIEMIDTAIAQLKLAKASSIAFACTSGTFTRGVQFDKEAIERIKTVSKGIPATTTSTAVIEALHKLNIRNVAVGTPYTDEWNLKLKHFLETQGFKVVSMKGLQCHGTNMDWEISSKPSEVAYHLATEVDGTEADGVFLSCTGLRTAEVLEDLEEDLEKPVISSNQATMWKSLRLAGIKTPVKGYGKLLLTGG